MTMNLTGHTPTMAPIVEVGEKGLQGSRVLKAAVEKVAGRNP